MTENNNITLLVVDDEEILRKNLVRNLELEEFKVFSAANGNEAFEIVKENGAIDFVISDIRMPNGTGVELLEKVKAHNKDLPHVLLITGYSEYSKEEVIAKGAIDLMNKPLDIDLIIELIKTSIKRS